MKIILSTCHSRKSLVIMQLCHVQSNLLIHHFLVSSFGYLSSVVLLAMEMYCTTTCVKKHAYRWKCMQAEEALGEIQEKDLGSVRVWEGKHSISDREEKTSVVAMQVDCTLR